MKKLLQLMVLSSAIFITFLFFSCGDSDGGDGGSGDGGKECVDKDGDRRGQYCDKGNDCDDRDPNNWLSCDNCKDGDGDDWFAGCDRYETIDGPDCRDVDAKMVG